MNALKSFAAGVALAVSLGLPSSVAAAPGSGGGHGSASGSHGSSGFHASGGFHSSAGFHSGPRAFASPRTSAARPSAESVREPTIAFTGHAAASANATAAAQRANSGSTRPTSGWDRHWDRIWHGRHYHWNDGAWVVINDGNYPWDDSYYLPASSDVYPDMSYDYGDTPSDAGAPNPAPNAEAVITGSHPDTIAADVQQGLASRGYYDGHVDGIVGDDTREAITDFQRDNNLPVTGYITRALLKALGL
jgi:Putative peptidoglycan binding domain